MNPWRALAIAAIWGAVAVVGMNNPGSGVLLGVLAMVATAAMAR